MNDDLIARIEAVERDTLTPYVQQVLDAGTAEIIDWKAHRITGGSFGVVYRFQGNAQVKDSAAAWSLILKVVRLNENDPFDRSAPTSPRYWKREPLAYQTGFLADLPGELRAPRCFGVVERSDRECWLWLEDVREEGHAQWPVERYGLAARHLGQFNGAYLVERPLPVGAWLGRRVLHATEEAKLNLERLPAALDHPMVRRVFPTDVAEGIFRLWDERAVFLNAIERLPQTVNHRDIFRRNLFAGHKPDGTPQTIAIDWEDAAIGPVGEEMVSPAVLSLLTFEVEMAAADTFEALLFDNYWQGLQGSGWPVDRQAVRLGYTLGMLRYGLGLLLLQHRAKDENHYSALEQEAGRPMPEIADHWADVLRFVLSRIDEARRLVSQG